jgi:DNA-binding NarL/FixJ family response regulator
MIRVLLADDHGVIRDGLGRLISALDAVTLVAAVADGAQAVVQHARLLPDVVLMDLDMPVMDGIEATKRIIAARPQTAVVVLTAFCDRVRIIGALEAGACGYLLKDVDAEEVGEAIRAAARGQCPLDPRVARTILDARLASGGPISRLSPRERQVLTLLVEGLPNKLIARRLHISEKTVKAHLTQIFRELRVSDRTQAALWAAHHGVTSGPDTTSACGS